jgi:hypothetical protein
MRKRIIIGLIAVVVIGVVVFLFSQPKNGSVEYHKRKYKEIEFSRTFIERVSYRGPRWLYDAYWSQKKKHIDFHRKALLRAGYLRERDYVISNAEPYVVLHAFAVALADRRVSWPVHTELSTLSNGLTQIRVSTSTNQLDKLDEVVREADVPRSGKAE